MRKRYITMASIEERKNLIKSKYSDLIFVKVDKNETLHYVSQKCRKCGGVGGADAWVYTGYTCYRCGGNGIDPHPQVLKFYTEEYEAKLNERRAKAQAKKEAERLQEAILNRESNLVKSGFVNENGELVIYRVIGNTFSIRSALKELGCKFNHSIGWYSSKSLDEYKTQRMTSDEVLTDNILDIEFKDRDELKSIFVENLDAPVSEWIGNIGDKLETAVHLDSVFSYDTHYSYYGGITYVHLFSDKAGNVYKWNTASVCLEDNKDYVIKATIKDHSEYKDVKQTVLTRVKVVA